MKQLRRSIGLVWLSGAVVSSAQTPGALIDLRKEPGSDGVRLVAVSTTPALFDYSSPSADEIVLRLHSVDPGLLVGPSQAWMPEAALEVASEGDAAGVIGTRLSIRLARFGRYRIRTEGNSLVVILLPEEIVSDTRSANPAPPPPVSPSTAVEPDAPVATGALAAPLLEALGLEEIEPETAPEVEPDVSEPIASELPAPEPEAPEPMAPEPMAPEPEAPEPETSEATTPAPEAAEPDPAEPVAPELPVPEAEVPESVSPEPEVPEPVAPEPAAPEPLEAPEPSVAPPPAPSQTLAETRDLSLSVGFTAPSGGAAPATRVLGLTHTREARSLTVHIETDGTPTHRVFGLQGPERLVLDLIGMQVDPPQQSLDVGSDGVRRVRLAQHQTSPQLVVRVVVDLEAPLPHRLVVGARSIKVIFAAR